MKVTEILHGFWVGTRTDHPKVKKSWLKIDKAIQTYIPEEHRQEFTVLLEDHCYAVEYGGFVAGFKTAMKLWKEL